MSTKSYAALLLSSIILAGCASGKNQSSVEVESHEEEYTSNEEPLIIVEDEDIQAEEQQSKTADHQSKETNNGVAEADTKAVNESKEVNDGKERGLAKADSMTEDNQNPKGEQTASIKGDENKGADEPAKPKVVKTLKKPSKPEWKKTIKLGPPVIATAQSSSPERFGYTLQVAAMGSQQEVYQLIQQLPNAGHPVWENSKQVNGKVWLAVLYGDYPTKELALADLKMLPKTIQSLKPFVKSIDAIKKSPYPTLKKLK
ncbi:SPOR domain-containing protein [Vibrio sp.]|nr:SPOR domain-containing protein [Vibrio sp.]